MSRPLFDFLETFWGRLSVPGLEWARENWQSVLDCIVALQLKAKSKPERGKAAVCAVLGATLAAAMEERAACSS